MAEPAPRRGSAALAGETPRAGAAMGVRFVGDPLPGLSPDAPATELPTTAVIRASFAELDERWAHAAAPRTAFEIPYSTGAPFLRVESDDAAGYLIWADGYGLHLVSSDGAELRSALPGGPAWVERRLLASQVLPLVAALHGREPLHAAGVMVAGRLIALTAPSGTGKSSTACHLVAQGGGFFADDVVALALDARRVLAHPGPRMVNVPESELAGLSSAERARLGRSLGVGTGRYLEPAAPPPARPLDGILCLERRPLATPGIAPLDDVAATLLASAALPHFDRPRRLLGQLEMVGALERTVPLARLRVGAAEDASRVAHRVRAWAEALA